MVWLVSFDKWKAPKHICAIFVVVHHCTCYNYFLAGPEEILHQIVWFAQ